MTVGSTAPAVAGTEATYTARMAAVLDRQAASMDRFADLSDDPRPTDLRWHAAVLRETRRWRALAEEARAQTRPASGPLSAVHARLLAAYAQLDRAALAYERGLAALDDAQIYAGIAGIDAAADLLAEVIAGLAPAA